MRSVLKRRLRDYAICFGAWTVLGFFFFTQALVQRGFSQEPTPWWHYLVSWMTGCYISALLTPVILWLGRRFPFERKKWLPRIPLHLLCSVCFALTQLGVESLALFQMHLFPTIMVSHAATFVFLLIIGFHQSVATYWTVLAIQAAIVYYGRYKEREQQALRLELHAAELSGQLAQAHLSALKMQLQPHFLFNTLNAIMVLVRQQKGVEAEEMLARLSDLLRCVLEDVESQEVPLYRELEYLKLYLSIEEVRFQDRLRVNMSADAEILNAAVPQMGLQPIVENAIRHGIGKSSSAGEIEIRARRLGDSLEITVQDDGPGLPDAISSAGSSYEGRGIGLTNTKARLKQLYGDAGYLVLKNSDRGGALVGMILPYRLAEGPPETGAMQLHAFEHITS